MKKISLEFVYSTALRIVFSHLGFLLFSMLQGVMVTLAWIAFFGNLHLDAGVTVYSILIDRFVFFSEMLNHAMNSAMGIVQYGQYTIEHYFMNYLPSSLSHYLLSKTGMIYELSNAKLWLLPLLLFKFLADLLAMGWYKLGLNSIDKKSVSPGDTAKLLFNQYPHFPYYFTVNLIVFVVTIIGCLLFVIPGIYAYQRLRFAKLFVIDQNMGIYQALEASWKATEGELIDILAFSFVQLLIHGLSTIAFALSFISYPLMFQAEVVVYRQVAR